MGNFSIRDASVDRNIFSFQKAVTEMRIDTVKRRVSETNASSDDFKMLTLDLVESCKGNNSKNEVSDIIESWLINLDKSCWHNDLVKYCEDKPDIVKALSAKKNGQAEFVIIVEDSTLDTVLDYNGFGFRLRRKYREVYDFMVLDVNTSMGIESMYETTNVIYERGRQSGNSTRT